MPLLAACATAPQVAVPQAPTPTEALGSFHLIGRVSVRHDDQGFSGTIDWRHSARQDHVVLLSPLGQGVAHLTRTDAGVVLVTSDQQQFVAEDVESLTERVLGWRLPLTGLRDWVQGQTMVGQAAEVRRGDDGRVAKISQGGWEIEYPGYKQFAAGLLPGRIFMERADLRLKLAIDDWRREP